MTNSNTFLQDGYFFRDLSTIFATFVGPKLLFFDMISFDLSVFIAPLPCFMPCRRLCYLDFLRDVSSVLLLFILRSRVFSGCLVPFATFFRGCPVVTSDFLGDVLDGLRYFVFRGFMVFVNFFGMYCTVCNFFSILTVIFSLNFHPKFYVRSKKWPKVLFSLRRS